MLIVCHESSKKTVCRGRVVKFMFDAKTGYLLLSGLHRTIIFDVIKMGILKLKCTELQARESN